MKLNLDKPAAKKAMRVATTLTGVTACAAAFAPTPAAQATAQPKMPSVGPHAGHGMRVRDATGHRAATTGLPEPYFLSVFVRPSVKSIQVCGWKHVGGGVWTCTGNLRNYNYPYYVSTIPAGGNWNRGKINVWWNNHHAGSWDTCNTNPGGFYGFSLYGGTSFLTVVLNGNSSRGIGYGTPTC